VDLLRAVLPLLVIGIVLIGFAPRRVKTPLAADRR